MNKNIPLIISGYVFGFIAVMHVLRAILQIKITVASYVVPMSFSYIGALVAITLALWMIKAASDDKSL